MKGSGRAMSCVVTASERHSRQRFLGPSPYAPFAGFQADAARAEGSTDGLEDASGGEWKWWHQRNQWQALSFRIRWVGRETSVFWGPELLIDMWASWRSGQWGPTGGRPRSKRRR